MEKVNGFLVKPKLGWLQKIRAGLAKDIDYLDLNHQIYVPDRLVLGNFKEREEGFVLSPGGIYYAESGDEMFREYGKLFEDSMLEIVRTLSIQDSDLGAITQQARTYRAARHNIDELVTPVTKYF